ncbi:MAG: PAS domain S-box protein, partial [Chthoniobacterales bacterium]
MEIPTSAASDRTEARLEGEDAFGQRLWRATVALILALGIPLLGFLALVLVLLRSAERVDNSQQVIARANLIERGLLVLQTNFRGYRLSSDEEFLARFAAKRSELGPALENLRTLVADNPPQEAQARLLRLETDAWLAFVDTELKRAGSEPGLARDPEILRRGSPLFDQTQERLERIMREEEQLHQARDRRLRHLVVFLLAGFGVAAAFGIPALSIWFQKLLRKVTGTYRASAIAAELRRHELRVTLNSIGDAVVATDNEGRVSFLNPSAEKLMGWTSAEARGRELTAVFDIFNEETGAKTPSPAARVLRENVVVGLANHTVLRARDGREIPIEDSAAPIRSETGDVLGVILVFRDVTEKRRSERDLQASEGRLRLLNQIREATRSLSAPEEIMEATTRRLGQHLRASRCAYAVVGSDEEQFTILQDYTDGCASTVGDYQLSLFGPRAVRKMRGGETLVIRDRDAELAVEEGAAMFRAIEVAALVCCPLVKEGGLRAMMAIHQTTPRAWTAAEVALVEEVVERCWATIERRRAEGELHASENLKSAILNTALDGFILMDHEGRIRDWNAAAERIFGVTRAAVLGHLLGEKIVPARLREAHQEGVARYVATREARILGRRFELPAMRKDGSEFPCEVS